MQPIGFGLVGCGIFGEVHARTYAASPAARLVAVCDQDPKRAQRFVERCGAESCVAEFDELLANPNIQAVAVATPDFAHTEIVLAAIAAGKHVIVEKPLATTVAECEKIIAARDAQRVKVMVDFHNRWLSPFVHVKRMVESGELGKLIMSNIRLNDTIYVPTKMLKWAAQSSPLHFLGSHVIDLVRWLSGAEVKRAFSVSRSVVLRERGIDTPDFFQSTLELTDGSTAVIENCWILSANAPKVYDFKAEFVGTTGSTFVDVSHHRMVEKYSDAGVDWPDVLGAYDARGQHAGLAAIEHFIEAIASDTAPLATAEDGLEATRVVEALESSARSGQPVEL